jgi:outer membrane protein X
MKKCFERVAILLALVMAGFGSVYAQEAGDMAVGANIVFTPGWVEESRGPNDPKSNAGGFGAKFQYNVTTPIRVEGAFTIFPSSDKLGMWNLFVNAHYLVPVVKKLNVYPIAGLGLMKYKSEGAYIIAGDVVIINTNVAGNYTIFGVNIGGGAEYKLSKKVSLEGEFKYIIGFDNTIFSDYYKTNRSMISIGAVYKF